MIHFRRHYIENADTGKRCRVFYSIQGPNQYGHPGDPNKSLPCVVVYAKGCGDSLAGILTFTNNTELQSDYFETDRACIREGDPLYAAVLEAAGKAHRKSTGCEAMTRAEALLTE